MTTFTTLHGQRKEVADGKIIIRPAAYAILIQAGSILLLKVKSTGKWFFPGGGLKANETIPDGLRREVSEETGLDIALNEQIDFLEHFFYYDPLDEAYHLYMYFFRGVVMSGTLAGTIDLIEEAKEPQWVPLRMLRAEDFDPIYHDLVEKIKTL